MSGNCQSLVDLGSISLEVQAILLDFVDDRLDVGVDVSLGVVSVVSEFLVEQKVLSPLELSVAPSKIFLTHLGEQQEI